MIYSIKPSKKLQVYKDLFRNNPFAFSYIEDCPPKNGCIREKYPNYFCHCQHCKIHGKYNRQTACNKLPGSPPAGLVAWTATFNPGVLLHPHLTNLLRQHLIKGLRALGAIEYYWRVQFKKYKPHFHTVLYSLPTSQFIEFPEQCKLLMDYLGIEPNRDNYFSIKPIRSWEGHLAYIHEICDNKKHSQAPPDIKNSRWQLAGQSKNFNKKDE